MKKIVVIDGHPDEGSLCYSLAEEYIRGAKEAGAEVSKIRIADLDFNPNLQYGYRKRMELEPDLQEAFKKIKEANHLVWVHPVWWGSMPAIMKGFIDRLFLSGLTYKLLEGKMFPEGLLKNKTAHIITTLDQLGWFYRLYYARPSINQLKKCTLYFLWSED